MAISRVTAQDCTASTGNNTTLTCSYPNTPTQGDLLISVCLLASGFSSVTTPSGYSVAFHEDCSNGAITVALAYKIAGAAESKNVTWSFSGSNGTINIDQHEYTGNVNSSPLDKTAVGRDGGSTEQTQATGTTATTTNANELVLRLWAGLARLQAIPGPMPLTPLLITCCSLVSALFPRLVHIQILPTGQTTVLPLVGLLPLSPLSLLLHQALVVRQVRLVM